MSRFRALVHEPKVVEIPTLTDILRGIDRGTFLLKSEKSAQKGVQKQGPIWSSYHSLIAICEGYFLEPWTNFENFTEAYTNLSKVHVPLGEIH